MATLQTTIQFVHSGDHHLVVTLNSPEVLGEMTGQVSTTRTNSGWGRVPGLVRQPLTPEGAAALGLPAKDSWEELWAWIVPLEPNEADDYATYLFEVRPSAMREAVAVVALNEKYEVADFWSIPQDAAGVG